MYNEKRRYKLVYPYDGKNIYEEPTFTKGAQRCYNELKLTPHYQATNKFAIMDIDSFEKRDFSINNRQQIGGRPLIGGNQQVQIDQTTGYPIGAVPQPRGPLPPILGVPQHRAMFFKKQFAGSGDDEAYNPFNPMKDMKEPVPVIPTASAPPVAATGEAGEPTALDDGKAEAEQVIEGNDNGADVEKITNAYSNTEIINRLSVLDIKTEKIISLLEKQEIDRHNREKALLRRRIEAQKCKDDDCTIM